ncbi:MAG: DEAD/DEAH box helicase [Fibrobacteria bacterium]|nr:DEAD/DEAH box helicase [Fibrobacteria bacterium]
MTPEKEEKATPTIIEPQPPLPDYALTDLPEVLQKTLKELGWEDLMQVQTKAIPYILKANDLICQAKTGSGKTGAFALPLLQIMESSVKSPQTLVMVPTRELARQVNDEFNKIANGLNIKSIAIYGGVGYKEQLDALKDGPHVVIGTPGRILDHLIKGTLNFNCLRDLVIDEADEMLSMGFYPDMKRIQKYLPKDRCSYMFSATMPVNVRRLGNEFLRKPQFLNLCSSEQSVAEMDRIYYSVGSMDKDKSLLKILEFENPDSALIFCNMKKDVQYVHEYLEARGLSSGMISSNVTQFIRERTLKDLKSRKVRFLVATDVAARGIDIKGLSHVILYDHPEDPETYVHRSGRTARAGLKGIAISLVTGMEEMALKKTGEKFGIHFIKKELGDEAQLDAVVQERTTILLEQELRDSKKIEVENAKRMVPLIEHLMKSDDAKLTLGVLLHRLYWSNFTRSKKKAI